jgi:hypothetical protein
MEARTHTFILALVAVFVWLLAGVIAFAQTSGGSLYPGAQTPTSRGLMSLASPSAQSVLRINPDGSNSYIDSAGLANWLGVTTDGALNAFAADPASNGNFSPGEWKLRTSLDQVPNYPAATQGQAQGLTGNYVATPENVAQEISVSLSPAYDAKWISDRKSREARAVARFLATVAPFADKIYTLVDFQLYDGLTPILGQISQASGTLTFTGQPSDGDTVTIGSQTYTFKTTLTPTAGEVLIGGSQAAAQANLMAAINAANGSGSLWAAGLSRNPDIFATNIGSTIVVTARLGGPAGNSLASTKSGANFSWGGSTLSGGFDGKAPVTLTGTTDRPYMFPPLAPASIIFDEPTHAFYADTGISSASVASTDFSYGYWSATDRNGYGEVMGFLNGSGTAVINLGNGAPDAVYLNLGGTNQLGVNGSYPIHSGLWTVDSTGTAGAAYLNGALQKSFSTSGITGTGNMLVGRGSTANPTNGHVHCGGYFLAHHLTAAQQQTLYLAWFRLKQTLGVDYSTEQYRFQTLAERTASVCHFTFTGGPISGMTDYGIYAGLSYPVGEYLRDIAMMYRWYPDLFSPSQVESTAKLFAETARGSDGAIYDGIATAGGVITANNNTPATDGPQELCDVIYSHYLKTGSPSLFLRYRTILLRAIASLPTINHLVYIADNSNLSLIQSGWGFEDQICNTGYNLNSSILLYRMYSQLSLMATAAGLASDATSYTTEKANIQTAIDTYLWDGTAGAFKSASIKNSDTHSVYGNAYGIITGAFSSTHRSAVLTWLTSNLANYEQSGFIRPLIASENYTYYRSGTSMTDDPAHGQLGGYWATFTGDVAKALAVSSVSTAQGLLFRCGENFRTTGEFNVPYENVNSAVSYTHGGTYNASAFSPAGYYLSPSR